MASLREGRKRLEVVRKVARYRFSEPDRARLVDGAGYLLPGQQRSTSPSRVAEGFR
jgi:hypothetical protein